MIEGAPISMTQDTSVAEKDDSGSSLKPFGRVTTDADRATEGELSVHLDTLFNPGVPLESKEEAFRRIADIDRRENGSFVSSLRSSLPWFIAPSSVVDKWMQRIATQHP